MLEDAGELKRIQAKVDPELEITEIASRVVKAGGPALLFEKVGGSDVPLLINAYGTDRRIAMALGVESMDEIAARVEMILAGPQPAGLIGKIKSIPKLMRLADFFPKTVKNGPCKEVIERENPSLFPFPILKCWPRDAGRFITLPLVFTRHPATGGQNCGIYRMQIYDDTTTGMHWHVHKGGAAHYRAYKERNERMPVAVAIGADPVVTFCGAAPLPDDFDEMVFAGFIRKKPVDMVKCETCEIEVPADAEIVLEGYVDPEESRPEGPFGDHTGFYSLPGEFPVFHVTCVTRRKDPVYHATVVGVPPMEDCCIGRAIGRIFLPVIRKQLPEIIDIHMPSEGVFHNLVVVSIRKAYPGHARKVMHALWGLGQMMFTKVVVVVDDDVDVHDMSRVVWKVLNNIDPERDIEFVHGPVDELDHASRLPRYGSKMGIDGTRKWKGEGFARDWPDEIKMTPEVIERVTRRWKEYGL
jgi:4-hydroxy-3-polyprenylbenzoate decarboxylase